MGIKESKIWSSLSREKRRFLSSVAPKYETSKIYEGNFGKPINWDNPQDINEKIQCLKFGEYYNNPLVTQCVDKFRVKDYVSKFEGVKYAKLYGVYNSPDEIRWDELPDAFVIKCNHGCGYNIPCNDKNKLDIEATNKQLKRWLKEKYWKEFCETQYKFIKKKILIEEYLGDDIMTYKFYCFNGIPKVLYVSRNGENGEIDKYYDYFDTEWNHLDVTLKHHINAPYVIDKPKELPEMVYVAKVLCKDFPFVRIDLYNIRGEIYLSEFTFVPTGGFMTLSPEETSLEWGSWLKI